MDEGLAGTAVAGPPYNILGYTIRSRTRIYVYYLIPAILEALCYIIQIVADCAVGYQHFINHQPEFGAATLALVLVPPTLTFIFVLTSRDQWRNPRWDNRWMFFGYQVLQLFLFPFFAIYRIAVRIFWSMEALFQDGNDEERMLCLAKAEECSTCELNRFIQAYGQSAPQIILQLYHMLLQDLFRDYSTTGVQALCLIFSAFDLAAITTSYHRFESQRQVGQRHYPWAPPQKLEAERRRLEQDERLRRQSEQRKRDSERTITSFPESDKIMENFKLKHQLSNASSTVDMDALAMKWNETEHNDELDGNKDQVPSPSSETVVLLHSQGVPEFAPVNATDDDKMHDSSSPKTLRLKRLDEMRHMDEIEILDTIPDIPAPLPPPLMVKTNNVELRPQMSLDSAEPATPTGTTSSRQKRASRTFSQLGTLRNMLIVDAELFIKEHVPRPPKMLTQHIDELQEQQRRRVDPTARMTTPKASPAAPEQSEDVVDFFFPRPTKVVNGIAQDDFAGKTVSFFGWIAYLIMRMLSLVMFLVFYPQPFFIVVGVQYVIMLGALFLETRFKGSLNRFLLYLLLAYVYVFVLIEFRIRFKHIRIWYGCYFVVFALAENIAMTVVWYTQQEVDSWWFQFIFECIMCSCGMFVATLIVYYWILRPKDVTIIVEDEEAVQSRRQGE